MRGVRRCKAAHCGLDAATKVEERAALAMAERCSALLRTPEFLPGNQECMARQRLADVAVLSGTWCILLRTQGYTLKSRTALIPREVPVPTRDDMLGTMERRSLEQVREGQPIIPDGPIALTQDMQEFKILVIGMGYEVKFGQNRAVTLPGDRSVHLTPRCSVGVLTDEFLHAWNNYAGRRGIYLDAAKEKEHEGLARVTRLSGSSNDRKFHQLELENYVRCLQKSGDAIPGFIWRTFSVLT